MPERDGRDRGVRLAVLIDADNVPRGTLKGIMDEVAIYGSPIIKRIYGDWTSPNIAGWKSQLLENAVIPVQQYSYTTGKNATDSAMIIDAMDILYTGGVDGFVLVSSDSDFTRLALRLREAGMSVFGIGEKKTPSAFIAACDKFIYIEVIRQHSQVTTDSGSKAEPERRPFVRKKQSAKQPKADDARKNVENLIAESIADIAAIANGDDGFVYMGELGNLLIKKQPDFDCRNFGHRSLSSLINSFDRFEVDFRQTADPNIKHPYVREKELH